MAKWLRTLSQTAAAASRTGRSALPPNILRTPPVTPGAAQPLPPIIVLHGLLASEATTRSLRKREDFAPKREKIGIDLRNHGQSPHVGVDLMTYDHMSNDVISLLDNLSMPKACLLGHSVGGKVAMHTALRHPSRISELIVVDIAPIRYEPRHHASDSAVVARAMAAVNFREMRTRVDVDEALQTHGVDVATVRNFVLTNLTRGDDGLFRWKPNIDVILESLQTLVDFPTHGDDATFTGRTCAIRGGKSHYVPFQAMRDFTRFFPNTKLMTIEDAGHWIPSQAPDEFVRCVNDFLAD